MKPSKQQIEAILDSLDGATRADAPPYLWSKIRNGLPEPAPLLRPRLAWQMAAALILFLLLNVFTLSRKQHAESGASSGSQAVAGEYSISLPQTY